MAFLHVVFVLCQQEEVDPNRSPKKPLGDTNFYCPVSLTERGVLWPGDPECSAKFREKIYYFADESAREKFLATPEAFLPKDSPPVVCFGVYVTCLHVNLQTVITLSTNII